MNKTTAGNIRQKEIAFNTLIYIKYSGKQKSFKENLKVLIYKESVTYV